MTRRETLKVGALSLLGSGFTLPNLLRAEQTQPPGTTGKAKSVILLYLLGGAATQDMWDLKPGAAVGVRSEFKPIATSAPGIQISDQLPLMARWMHKAALVRSVNHKAGCHNCLPSYCGFEVPQPDQHPKDTHPPSMGSVCEFLERDRDREFPSYVYMPCWLGWGQVFRRAGPYAGFLGKRFDPFTTECRPYGDKDANPLPGKGGVVYGSPLLPDSDLGIDMTIDRLHTRKSLLQQIDDKVRRTESLPSQTFDRQQQRSLSLLTSSTVRSAFDLSKEDPKALDRYDQTLFGHSTFIARRLVEAGVRFVNVTWDLFWDRVKVDYDAWDTHSNNYPILKGKLPRLDKTFDGLMRDLTERGLLDETLVVIMSEMGRTPRVNGNGGRDHWTHCYSVMLAGAGIRGGTVYGASDGQAAYVKDNPVSTADICATIYSCLGIDPDTTVPDRTGRPVAINNGGQAIRDILV